MTPQAHSIPSILRLAVLGAIAAAGLTACTRTEVTETNCVRVAEENPAGVTEETLACDSQRFQLIYRDKYSEEPEVVTDETW